MTALKPISTPVIVRTGTRTCRGGAATHQEATLLALHFRSASWTPCVSAPTLLAAAAIVRTIDAPEAEWDAWFFRSEGDSSGNGPGACLRRSRLRAEGLAGAEPLAGTPWILIVEERTSPGSAGAGRRLVIELDADPFESGGATAPVDPLAIASVSRIPSRRTDRSNPSPDLTVDLVALGLIAPRARSW